MPYRKIEFRAGHYYQLYNRGVNRQPIFLCDDNWGYFRQQGRVGSLFQGPFQAVWVDRDEYLLHLSRYIHVNPVTAGLVARPEEWVFSSYRDYIGLREGTLPVPGVVLSQFSSCQAYRAFVESYRDQDVRVIDHLLFEED